eukprot:scaffold6374_cov121-Cylindrotheca_fusiformis.AAC.7
MRRLTESADTILDPTSLTNSQNTLTRKDDLTMVLPIVAVAARRRVGMIAKQQTQRRGMAAAPAPEWEGIDKVVRDVFPKDHQLALAIMGGYAGLYVLVKIKSLISGGKKEEAAPASSGAAVDASTGIPPIDSPEFDKYLETDAFYKMLESEEQLGKVVEDMK